MTSTSSGASLGRRASFWVAAAVSGHTLWTSAAPAVTYPLYAAQWGLTTTVTTGIFAVFPIVLVAVLVLFGNLSDFIGRRNTLLLGVGASAIGALLFALAPSIAWVFAGRAFMGIGVGLSTSPATAAVVEFSAPGQSQRASSVTTVATALGLALATLVGGALIQYAPWPTRLNFWVLFGVLCVLFAAVWFLPRTTRPKDAPRWRPRALGVPPGLGNIFTASLVAVTAGYTLGALILSLGSQIARDLIGSGNALVNGAAISVFAIVIGAVAILAKQRPARSNIVAGGIASAVGMGLLALAAAHQALAFFLAASAVCGVGYSLLFLGGLTLISAHAPASTRAGTLAVIYLVAFLAQGVTALLLGRAATTWGLSLAVDIGAPAIGLVCLAAVALALLPDKLPGAEEAAHPVEARPGKPR